MCWVLSSTGLCDELITRSEEYYRAWCVVVCDLDTSRMRTPPTAIGKKFRLNISQNTSFTVLKKRLTGT